MEMARILAFSVKSIERDEAMKQEVDSALRLVPNDGYMVMIAALFQTDMDGSKKRRRRSSAPSKSIRVNQKSFTTTLVCS